MLLSSKSYNFLKMSLSYFTIKDFIFNNFIMKIKITFFRENKI